MSITIAEYGTFSDRQIALMRSLRNLRAPPLSAVEHADPEVQDLFKRELVHMWLAGPDVMEIVRWKLTVRGHVALEKLEDGR